MSDPLISEARTMLYRPYRLTFWRLWLLLVLIGCLAASCTALIVRYPAHDQIQPSIPRRTGPAR